MNLESSRETVFDSLSKVLAYKLKPLSSREKKLIFELITKFMGNDLAYRYKMQRFLAIVNYLIFKSMDL